MSRTQIIIIEGGANPNTDLQDSKLHNPRISTAELVIKSVTDLQYANLTCVNSGLVHITSPYAMAFMDGCVAAVDAFGIHL